MNGEDANVNLVDLMGRLIEPEVPAPVSLVPQTAGWWVLGALVLTALAYALWRGWLHWRANAYRRTALAALATAGNDPAAIAAILRRTALAAYPRREVAGLAGPDWVAFLNATGGFPEALGPALIRAPYAREAGAADLRAAAIRWIRGHRRAS
ncbi:DUF4381 domain-containing protein [Defluviimonas salinarum]|uniref:DUF4381 domain-containing protein n=1 Tax=Defluviimonas salinarum TaxID=2992147 RepID=A0ABT3J2W3_9RHOB|nr:DUF4381 domain-containing protein [Defluviimonas salinarum]MCW3782014.1 DUF4381 domain-containing protein [Defluviimonas salinarum]